MPARGGAGVPWGNVGLWGVDGAAGWFGSSTGGEVGWTLLTVGGGARGCDEVVQPPGVRVDEFVHGCLFGWVAVAVFSGLRCRWHVWCCWDG